MAAFDGVDAKLRRAHDHLLTLFDLQDRYRMTEPFSVAVIREDEDGRTVGRLKAVRNLGVPDPDVSIVLLAGELIYQLRSSLDHAVVQLVIANGHEARLDKLRPQFPIYLSSEKFATGAPAMLDGVSNHASEAIELLQPFVIASPDPSSDVLWTLHQLNNQDKHRLIPVTVHGIGVVNGYSGSEKLFYLQSADVVLEDGKIFFSFIWPVEHSDIRADMHATISFADAMSPYGTTLGLADVALSMWDRVNGILGKLRLHV
jgi:hypothetical protein